jgi:uncharacterized protein YjbI with pentapeptide repeats
MKNVTIDAKCPFSLMLPNGNTLTCDRPTYRQHGACIFHSPFVKEKEVDFAEAFLSLLKDFENQARGSFDFAGFIFPRMIFRNIIEGRAFHKPVYWQGSKFTGRTSFVGCVFKRETDFSDVEFLGDVTFKNCPFSSRAKFIHCRFAGRASFYAARFAKRVVFQSSTFERKVDFTGSEFNEETIFQSTIFHADAVFRDCTFSDLTNFASTEFAKRGEFKGATFSNEIILVSSKIGFLKNPPSSGIVLDGAILESAYLWNMERLTGVSFRHAFLLSLNLSKKEVIDCDFTGAVFKAVLTQGWKPDRKTLRNTKHIYTDYEVLELENKQGTPTRFYRRNDESRVPAEGSFGEGEHANFTIADYLTEPLKWTLALSVPPYFRTAVLNYIQFFTDFMKVTEGVALEIRTRQEGSKLRVEFMTDSLADKELVQQQFTTYRENTTKDFASLDITFKNSQATALEIELFKIKYEQAITALKTELGYTQRLLQKEEEKNRLHDKYSALLHQAKAFSVEPQKLLTPASDVALMKAQTPIFFLTADLQDYSAATRGDHSRYPLIQTFLFDQKERIENDSVCEAVKLEGDAIKVFLRDGLRLIWVGTRLITEFQDYKYLHPTPIRGFRIVLGFGTCYREQRGSNIDYSGSPIVETVRVDQPMKRYIEEHREDPNQVWCTESFFNELVNKHSNVVFEELPPTDLDKDYGPRARLFRVKVE